jgi:secreted PhoX family phosphatase
MNEFDDLVVNPTGKKSLTELANPQRRNILISSAIAALFSQNILAAADKTHSKLFSFDSVPYSRANDDIQLPAGYRWSVVAAWGDSINGHTKNMSPDVSDSAIDQELQFGMHHDGCATFPCQSTILDLSRVFGLPIMNTPMMAFSIPMAWQHGLRIKLENLKQHKV